MKLRLEKISTEEIELLVGICIIAFFNLSVLPTERQEGYVFYLGFILWGIFFAFLSEHIDSKKARRLFMIISIFFLSYVMTFRAQTGTDDRTYKAVFENAGRGFTYFMRSSGMEVGFKAFMYMLYHFTGGNYNVAQIVVIALSFFFWGLGIKTYEEQISMPVAILFIWTHMYFIIMNHGLLRIYLAVAIVFYALQYIDKKQYKKYIFWIFIASIFHISAWIMLIMLLLSIEREFLFRYWHFFLIAVVVIMPIAFIGTARYLVPLLGARYAGYAAISQLRFRLSAFDTAPIFLVGLYYLPRIEFEKKRLYIIALILVALSAIFSLFSSMVSLGRVVYYANTGIILLVSMICRTKGRTLSTYAVKLVVILYAFMYVDVTVFLNDVNSSHLFPYKSMFH